MRDAETVRFTPEVVAELEKRGPQAWVIVENVVRTCLRMPALPQPTKPMERANRRPKLHVIMGGRHA